MEPFKELLNYAAAEKIVAALKRSAPDHDFRPILRGLEPELKKRELKARVVHIADRLREILPSAASESFPILRGALQQDEGDSAGLSGFLVWPLAHYVAENGLGDFAESMATLEKITHVFTAEFSIRPFLVHHEARTLKQLHRWLRHPDEHVRRLVSEGSRPLLPWGGKLVRFVEDPAQTWPLLDALRDDPSEYVRKSVANHINDHTKNHGDWVVEKLRAWSRDLPTPPEPRLWIIRHASRTLIKQGHAGALQLQGVRARAVKVLDHRVLTPKIKLGDYLRVSVKIKNSSARPVKIIVDHELGLRKSRGHSAPKVFKGVQLTLAGDEVRTLELQVRLKAVTTRTYHAGEQSWAPRINGVKQKDRPFTLAVAGSSA